MQVYSAYLINLDSSVDRLAEAKSQLENANISFVRIPAVDGRGVDPNTHAAYNEKLAISYMGRKINGGELGCYLSHLNVAKAFLSTDKQYALVLEDDISIDSDLGEIVNQLIQWLEENYPQWDLINMGDRRIKLHSPLYEFNTGNSGHTLTRAHYFPMTTHGILWSRIGAQRFIERAEPIYMPVDNYMREWLTKSNTGLAVWPPLVKTSGADSVIDNQTVAKRTTTYRSPFYGFLKQKRQWRNKYRAWRHKRLTK